MVAQEVSTHMCCKKFDLEQFQRGIAVLQAEQNEKSVPLPPLIPPPMPAVPPPKAPPMPAVPLYVATSKSSRSSCRNKGWSWLKLFLF